MIDGDAEPGQHSRPAGAQRAAAARVGQAARREPVGEVRRVWRDVEVAGDDERFCDGGAAYTQRLQLAISRSGAPRPHRRAQVHPDDGEQALRRAHSRLDRRHAAERERRLRLELVARPKPDAHRAVGRELAVVRELGVEVREHALGVRRQLLDDQHVGVRFTHELDQPARRELPKRDIDRQHLQRGRRRSRLRERPRHVRQHGRNADGAGRD